MREMGKTLLKVKIQSAIFICPRGPMPLFSKTSTFFDQNNTPKKSNYSIFSGCMWAVIKCLHIKKYLQ